MTRISKQSKVSHKDRDIYSKNIKSNLGVGTRHIHQYSWKWRSNLTANMVTDPHTNNSLHRNTTTISSTTISSHIVSCQSEDLQWTHN